MSGKYNILFTIMMVLGVSAGRSDAQDYHLGNTLAGILNKGYPASYIQGYMQSFATAMGTSVNGTSFHSARVNFFPHVEIGINAVYISVPDEARYFLYNGQERQTFFGPLSNELDDISGSGMSSFTIPQIQLDLGMFSYFQASLRVTRYNISEMGEISLLGLGVKYGLSDLVSIDFIPLEVSVQAFYHAYSIEDWLSSGSFAINLQNSARLAFLPVEIFAGLGYERVSLKIKSDNLPGIGENAAGDIPIDGKNGVRITLGAGLQVWLINMHAEYNYGFYNSAGGGLSIRF